MDPTPIPVFSTIPRQRLRDLIARQGQSLLNSPNAEATLRAVCHGFDREGALLAAAFRAGIPLRILAAPAMPARILADDLAEAARLTPEAAAWAVESWADAVAGRADTLAIIRQHAAPAAMASAGQAAVSLALISTEEPNSLAPTTILDSPPILEYWVWPPEPSVPEAMAATGNTSGTEGPLPQDVDAKKWHWGACSLSWLWLIFHKKPLLGMITLLAGFVPLAGGLIGLALALHFGANGYKIAWQSRRFESVDEFFAVQDRWSLWGTVVTLAATGLIVAGAAWLVYCQQAALPLTGM